MKINNDSTTEFFECINSMECVEFPEDVELVETLNVDIDSTTWLVTVNGGVRYLVIGFTYHDGSWQKMMLSEF